MLPWNDADRILHLRSSNLAEKLSLPLPFPGSRRYCPNIRLPCMQVFHHAKEGDRIFLRRETADREDEWARADTKRLPGILPRRGVKVSEHRGIDDADGVLCRE